MFIIRFSFFPGSRSPKNQQAVGRRHSLSLLYLQETS
jgi:hypothetical protein